jgi:hypothetical protein
MIEPAGDESFRGHWLKFPVEEFLRDADPTGPAFSIQIRTGEDAVVIEVDEGEIRISPGCAPAPDFMLEGKAPLVLGVLVGMLTLPEARRRGLRTSGNPGVLRRLQPDAR